MANEIRLRQLSIGGLVEDNPLTSGATTLTSAGLASVSGGVTSTQHLAIVLDPDGVDGAPEVVYVTALTAAAGSGTIARAKEGTTARQHVAGTPWVHGATPLDVLAEVTVTRPTDQASRTSATLGSLDTPWTSTIVVGANESVRYRLDVSMQTGVDSDVVVALVCDGTIIDRTAARGPAADHEYRIKLDGVHSTPGTGSHTYEVYVAQPGASAVYVSSVVDTSTASTTSKNGVSSLTLERVRAV